jgi:hypothetical protein
MRMRKKMAAAGLLKKAKALDAGAEGRRLSQKTGGVARAGA